MATARLVIVLLMLGTVVLLAVQNTSPTLPLVFLGGQTVALPLSVWLLIAICLGALTTLGFTALLGSRGKPGGRSKAYKYRPQPFYEPANPDRAAREAAEDMASGQDRRSAGRSSPRPQGGDNRSSDNGSYGGEWQDWNNLQTSHQWNDWDAMEQAAQAQGRSSAVGQTGSKPASGGGIGSWLWGNRKAMEEDQVNQSWQELSDDWDDLDQQPYRARGVSPVEENLDDINQGWENAQGYSQPPRDFEVPQSPKRVYQDGSLYSYSYRNQDGTRQRDNIYAPADDVVYGDQGFDQDTYINLSPPEDYPENYGEGEGSSPADYGAEGYAGDALEEPEVAEDGVVDADYRVIIPPSPTSAGTPPEPEPGQATWKQDNDDNNDDDDDGWSAAEDVLTP